MFRSGEAETARVEAFSDGVLAIVITLLVLDIKVPHVAAENAALWTALFHLLPTIGAWVVSFLFVLVFWVAHHYLFTGLRKVDRGLLWLNGLFLLFMSFMPFPTEFAGDYPLASPPLALLSGTMFGAAASFTIMRIYVLNGHGFIAPEARPAARVALKRSALAPLLYAASFVSAFLEPRVSAGLLTLVPIIYFFPSRSTDRK
jgi:uncharacterized membrane protein